MVAKRNLVEIKRRDKRGRVVGLDYALDEPMSVLRPEKRAPMLWANHPLGRSFVQKLLRGFYDKGDVQMLAMLTTVFAMETLAYSENDVSKEVHSGVVTIRFKNREKFDAGRQTHNIKAGLLDFKERGAHSRWRQSYADQLHAWGLPFARLEILQLNTTASSLSADGQGSTLSFERRSSRETAVPAQCEVCWELVHGYCLYCAECEHACHPGCAEGLFDGQDLGSRACLLGCGCECDENASPV